MILQTLILAVACTGVVQNGPTTHTLYYDVGRGLIGNMVLNDDVDSYYINTYVDFDNFRVQYNSGQITGIYCDNITLIHEVYDSTDTLSETISHNYTGTLVSNQNLYNVDIEFTNYLLLYNNQVYSIYNLYINDIYIDYVEVRFPNLNNGVIPDITASITFLDDNFYTYYDYNVGNTSYQAGYDRGYQVGFSEGKIDGYNDGYVDGYNEAFSGDTTALTIFSGITTIAMLPIDMFLRMFNFEILGINLSSFITALLTLYVVVFLIKTVTGSKTKGD